MRAKAVDRIANAKVRIVHRQRPRRSEQGEGQASKPKVDPASRAFRDDTGSDRRRLVPLAKGRESGQFASAQGACPSAPDGTQLSRRRGSLQGLRARVRIGGKPMSNSQVTEHSVGTLVRTRGRHSISSAYEGTRYAVGGVVVT